MSWSFFNIVGGICGAEERTSTSTSVIALTQCYKDIRHHKKSLKFSETEVELILWRCGHFQKPPNLLEMTICPSHRSELGTTNLCFVPEVFSGHRKGLRKVPALQKGINLFQSFKLLKLSNQFVPVGSGK